MVGSIPSDALFGRSRYNRYSFVTLLQKLTGDEARRSTASFSFIHPDDVLNRRSTDGARLALVPEIVRAA